MSKYNQKYSKELLEEIVKECISFAAVLRKLGLKQSGGTQSYITKKVKEFNIDTSHFKGSGANSGANRKGGNEKLSFDQILVFGRNDGRREGVDRLRRALIESGTPERCGVCLLPPEWNGRKLVLQIDHIDGDFSNNCKENLRFICPNCHTQTKNFGVKNAAHATEND